MMLFKSFGSFLGILTFGLSLHASDLEGEKNHSKKTASAPWGDLPNEIWVNIFTFLSPSQDWGRLVQVNKTFGEIIKQNLLTASYLASHNPKYVPFTFKIFQALGETETGLRDATEYFCKNSEHYKQFWSLFLPLTKTLDELEKGTFRQQGAFGESFQKAKELISTHTSSEQALSLSNQNLSFLPPEIEQLTALDYLKLSYNQLTEIPSGFSQLKALQSLYLNNNQLTEIPSGFSQLTALTLLDVSGNLLSGKEKKNIEDWFKGRNVNIIF